MSKNLSENFDCKALPTNVTVEQAKITVVTAEARDKIIAEMQDSYSTRSIETLNKNPIEMNVNEKEFSGLFKNGIESVISQSLLRHGVIGDYDVSEIFDAALESVLTSREYNLEKTSEAVVSELT